MERERLDRWCEWGILGLVLAVLAFGPLATGAVRPLDFFIIQGLTMGVLVLWVARLWINPRPRLLWPPICWAVLAFVAYAIARYRFADLEIVARQELIRVLIYAFLFFAILNNLHRQEMTQIVSLSMLFLGMVISFYAIYQFLTDSDRVWQFIMPYKHRGSGTYISPNHLAGFLGMLLPLGAAYTLTGRMRPVTKVLVGYASLVIVAGIGVTISRGGWVASSVAMLLFSGLLFLRRKYRLQAMLLLAVVALAGTFFAAKTASLRNRFEQTFLEGKVNDMRVDIWRPATQMWRDHFWWGVGPAHFDHRFRAYRPEEVQLRPDRVHNDYLNTLADWGIVGTLLVAAAWVLLYLGVLKTWKFVGGTDNDLKHKKSNKFSFVIGASLGLMAILLHSAVDFNMHIPANAILAVTLMALLSSHLRFASDRYWMSPGLWGRALASIVLLAGVGYLGWQTVRRGTEYVRLERAALAAPYSPEQITALKRAFAVEPENFETAYAIAEAYRIESWEGGEDYEPLAREAMGWYERTMKLNRYDGYSWMRYGMCLHWIGRHDEAWRYFEHAQDLDPNGYFTVAHMGWHYVQTEDYAAAKPWFERSIRLQWVNNAIARSYLDIVNRKLLEGAAKP